MLTNVHKCVGESAGIYFILSIFNPYNGLRGIIGPALYLGAIISWVMTIFYTVFTIWIKFDIDFNFHTYLWPLLYTLLIIYGCFLYILALVYGTFAENVCSKFAFKKIQKFTSVEMLEKYTELQERHSDTNRVILYDISKEFDAMDATEASLLKDALSIDQ